MSEPNDAHALPELFRLWREHLGPEPLRVGEIVSLAEERDGAGFRRPGLRQALLAVAEKRGRIATMRLVAFFARHHGRVVDGLRLERVPSPAGNFGEWRLADVARPAVAEPAAGAAPAAATFEWEVVSRTGAGVLRRTRVPGGWLFWLVSRVDGQIVAGLTFVPGPPGE